MIPKGTYRAVVDGPLQFGTADTGTEQVVATFRILDEGDAYGQTVAWFGFFTDKTWKRTMESLRYCGWKGDDITNPGALDQEIEIVVDHEADQKGEMRAKVRWVNRIGGGRVQLKKPMEADQLRKFAAWGRMKAREIPEVKSDAAPAARRTEATNHGDPPQQSDDDLPF